MRNIKKQINNLAALIETVLEYRLDPSRAHHRHLADVYKRICLMNQTQRYESAISQMLLDSQAYQIKNKIHRLLMDEGQGKFGQLSVGIHLSVIKKQDGEVFNSQYWQFDIQMDEGHEQKGENHEDATFIQAMEHTLRNLRCFSLFPGDLQSKANRNKLIFNYEIKIQPELSDINLEFQNMSCHEAFFQSSQNEGIRRLTSRYFYNNSKFEELLRERVEERAFSGSQSSRKNSSETTDSSRKVSLFEHYDDELEITVLSSSDFGDNDCQEIHLDLGKEGDSFSSDEFQILIQETFNDDELFLNHNLSLLRELQL